MTEIRLNDRERTVLIALASDGQGGEYCFPFAPLMKKTGMTRNPVRLACRSLARKGLARYERGLWSEEGDMLGAGYGITDAGLVAFAALPKAAP